MNVLFLSLLRALTTPDGADGGFLPVGRKSHLLQAEWYGQLAAKGEKERPEAHPPASKLIRSR